MRAPTQEVLEYCITRVIDRTSNAVMSKAACMVCARLLFVREMNERRPSDLPNKHLLAPTHPHPAQSLLDGMLLHQPALGRGKTYVCVQCETKLNGAQRPSLSLANNMWIGDVPFALSVLTLPERLLIGLYFPAAYIVKLFPKTKNNVKWDKDTMNKGLRGNVSTYRLNTAEIAEMIQGNTMPRPVSILSAVVSVTFVGAKNVPLMVLPDTFIVRRGRVGDALHWLKTHNPLFANIDISEARLQELPEGGVPDEIARNAHYNEDESVIDQEHAGYVPADIAEEYGDFFGDDAIQGAETNPSEPRAASEEGTAVDEGTDPIMTRLPDEAEERAEAEHTQREEDGDLDASGEGDWAEFDPAVVPLQAHGSIDVAADSLTDAELFESAALNIMGSAKRDYLIRRGSTFVNEYPRTDADGRRTDGGPNDANHTLGAYPTLWPYGVGGIEVDRVDAVSYAAHVKWCLQYDDKRFRKHMHFMFQAFSTMQRRQVSGSASLQIKRSAYIANEAAFARLRPEDFAQASEEEQRGQAISNPVVRALRKQITTVRSKVMGTDESRIAIRSQVWGMSLRFNPPTIWATLNLSDTGDPIAQVLAGKSIDLDKFIATAGPNSEERRRTIAADPFAAAEYFHETVRVILEEAFGIVVNPRGAIDRRPGIVGTVNGYIGTGAPTADTMRTALQSDRFQEKMRRYISSTIRAHVKGTTGKDVLNIPVEPNIAYSRPEDPRLPNYNERADAAERRIARAVQVHSCTAFTCLKLKKGVYACKRRAPWRTAMEDWVTETGEWGPKRLYSRINAWNPTLMQLTRCNQDMKIVTNGTDTKDITFYITLYIAKRQIQAANASALFAKNAAMRDKLDARQQTNAELNKRLLQQCANTLSRQHEFSAPEVVSYLMGWGDRFISHSYVRVYWDQMTLALRNEFPDLLPGNVCYQPTSTMEAGVSNSDGSNSTVTLTNQEGRVELKDQLKEYIDRGHELEDMSLYDYFSQTYDGKDIPRDEENSLDDARPRRGGRPRSDRVAYLSSSNRARCRVIRGPRQEVNIHFIGRWFPRSNDPNREYYCAQMLLLLRPWRRLGDLKTGFLTFDDAFDTFSRGADDRVHRLIANIQYFYQCSDRATRRDEEETVVDDEGTGDSRRSAEGMDEADDIPQPTNEDIRRALSGPLRGEGTHSRKRSDRNRQVAQHLRRSIRPKRSATATSFKGNEGGYSQIYRMGQQNQSMDAIYRLRSAERNGADPRRHRERV
ncbi:ATP-dependent DNA helicase [Mycena kentingensis (nom. inval.)]|nr:ATP-dependent DNA helicase [Mycena kentingensis (nom. inval.)]